MDFLELVTAARTCRRFRQDEGLPEGSLDWLVECARRAPCAGNAQALRYALASSPEACEAMYHTLKWAALLKWGGPAEGERPCGYIVLLGKPDRAKLNGIDAGIAAQTIQLAAQTKDLGCCIFLSFNPAGVRSALDIPEDLEPLLVLAIGRQKEVRVLETAEESLAYWRDEQDVHHVPKLAADRLVIIRK